MRKTANPEKSWIYRLGQTPVGKRSRHFFKGDLVDVYLAVTALLSAYVVWVKVMWRQAPITAALVIALSLEQHSKLSGIEIGLRRVGEVILGCIVGLLVTWLISKIWPPSKNGNTKILTPNP
jgi:uncharacterized membrane protein YccC